MATASRFTAAASQMDAGWSLARAAAVFADAGVPVFPCAPGGKQPITRRGFHDATTNPVQVQAWWRRFPEANIGLPTGAASGVVVVDVDVHGTNGFDALTAADRAGLVAGWELQVRSPSGGLHLYFPAPAEEQPSWQAGRAGIDFRGDRGYIIAPPSHRIVDGQDTPYRVSDLAAGAGRPVDATRLRRFLDPPRPPRTPPATGTGRAEGWADARKMADWLGQQDTDRNLKLFWASCRLAEGGVPYADALDALLTVEQPDFGQREITRTVTSAYRTITANTTPRLGSSAPGPARQPVETPAPRQRAPAGRGL